MLDGVFTIFTNDSSATVTHLSGGLPAAAFREAAGHVYRHPEWLLTPGTETLVQANPSDVSWRLHPGLSAMWLAQDIAVSEARALGQALVTDMLAGNSQRRRALIDCSVAAYHAAGVTAQLLDGAAPGRDLLGVVAGGATCANAWRVADEDLARRLTSLSDNLNFVSRLDTQLTRVRSLGRIFFNLATR